MRAKLRRERELPKLTKSNKLNVDPSRVTPYTLRVLPNLMKDRKLIVLPRCT
jgi:hypothetical protein